MKERMSGRAEEFEITELQVGPLGQYPLKVIAKKSSTRISKSWLEIFIPVPTGYKSRLVNKMRAESPLLGGMSFAYLKFSLKKPTQLWLDYFYVRAKEFEGQASAVEKAVFESVGRRLLCYGIRLLAQEMKNPAASELALEASGGVCKKGEANAKYKHWTYEKIDEYLKDYQSTRRFLRAELKERNMKELRNAVCIIENNRRLVRYYNRYGLEAYDSTSGNHILMKAPLSTVVEACQAPQPAPVAAGQEAVVDAVSAAATEAGTSMARKSRLASVISGLTARKHRPSSRAHRVRAGDAGVDIPPEVYGMITDYITLDDALRLAKVSKNARTGVLGRIVDDDRVAAVAQRAWVDREHVEREHNKAAEDIETANAGMRQRRNSVEREWMDRRALRERTQPPNGAPDIPWLRDEQYQAWSRQKDEAQARKDSMQPALDYTRGRANWYAQYPFFQVDVQNALRRAAPHHQPMIPPSPDEEFARDAYKVADFVASRGGDWRRMQPVLERSCENTMRRTDNPMSWCPRLPPGDPRFELNSASRNAPSAIARLGTHRRVPVL
eukprot:jgi/Mesvir1/19143/Mv01166-RA.1